MTVGTPVLANCDDLQPLAVMHDNYRALLSETTPQSKATAANQLIELVTVYPARIFKNSFESMSLDIELARLEKVLVDSFFLSRDILFERVSTETMPQYHRRNADWLTDLIARTGCFIQPTSTPSQASAERASSIKTALQNLDLQFPSQQDGLARTAFVVFFVALLIGATGYAIYGSRYFRIKRVERLPRHTIAFKAKATFNSAITPIIVLDISMGGAKIECDHPPVDKQEIVLHLPCGSVPATIVWSTAFYAGVMFETHLSEDMLQRILDDDNVTTRSRISNVF